MDQQLQDSLDATDGLQNVSWVGIMHAEIQRFLGETGGRKPFSEFVETSLVNWL